MLLRERRLFTLWFTPFLKHCYSSGFHGHRRTVTISRLPIYLYDHGALRIREVEVQTGTHHT
jgi:hypothetical protein